MKEDTTKGRGFLKDKMTGFRADPPEEVWSSIASRMGGRGRKRALFIILVSAASLALAITLGIHWFGPVQPAEIANMEFPEAEEQVPLPLEKAPEPEHKLKEQKQRKPPTEKTETGSAPLESGHKEKAGSAGEVPGKADLAEILPEEPVTVPAVKVTVPVEKEPGIEELPQAGEQMPTGELAQAGTGISEIPDVPVEGLKNRKKPGWMVGATLSPLYSYRDAEAQYMNPGPGKESGTVSYAGGVQVGYRATGRLMIETGILFNRTGINIGADGIQYLASKLDLAPINAEEGSGAKVVAISNTVGNIVSESGDIYVNNYLVNSRNEYANFTNGAVPEVTAEEGIRQHLDFLEFPVNLRFTILDRNIKLHILGGLSTNVLVNNYVSMETGGSSTEIGYLTNIRTVNYSGNAGIGISYRLPWNLSFSVEPRFRYFLNSVNDASLPATRPYTVGLYTGLSYLF